MTDHEKKAAPDADGNIDSQKTVKDMAEATERLEARAKARAKEGKTSFTFNLGNKAKTTNTTGGACHLYGKNGTVPQFESYIGNIAKRLAILIHTGIAPEGTKMLVSTSEAVAVFPDGTKKRMFGYSKGDRMDTEIAGYDNTAELEAEKKASKAK